MNLILMSLSKKAITNVEARVEAIIKEVNRPLESEGDTC